MLDPRWCITDHATDAAKEWHFGALHAVPAVLSQPFISDDSTTRVLRSTELEIALKQHDDDDEAWVYVGPDDSSEHSLILSIESARRMARTLTRLLDTLESNQPHPA